MRIAYLTQAYPPIVSGAAIFAGHLAESIARLGHQVMVLAPSGDGTPRVMQQGNLTVISLRSFHNPLRVRQRFMIGPHNTLLDALKEFKPDVIHSHDFFQVGLAGIQYARCAGIPTMTTLHQLPWFVSNHLSKYQFLRHVTEEMLWGYARWLLRQFTGIVAPTQTVANVVTKRTSLPIRVISYGVDLSTFHPPLSSAEKIRSRIRLNLLPGVPIILHVGQLHRAKRVDRAINAAAQAMRDTNAHLLVVGDGPQKASLMDLCKSLGIEDRAHFPGYITAEAGLPEAYRAADVFITASEIETQGIVLLEAAASGLPIAAVDATCIGEIVHDGGNGYLTGSGDIGAMSESIRRILTDAQIAGAMSVASRSLAGNHSNIETIDKYERMYDMLPGREPLTHLPKTSRHERLYNWLAAIVRR
jgi:glycosyltransferase involved in cell wall biosynthesis